MPTPKNTPKKTQRRKTSPAPQPPEPAAPKTTPPPASAEDHARARQVEFYVQQVIAQNAKELASTLWIWAVRRFRQNTGTTPENWPRPFREAVEARYYALLASVEFLTPRVRFHLSVTNLPRLMDMTLYVRNDAAVIALSEAIEEYSDEL